MSSINTNGINVNYPVAGNNNNSQGFRDNFAAIKNNLNTAGAEITNLQNVVVVKTALANTTLNNDMGNTLISNAAIRNFRSTTYNLGGSLSGPVDIDVELGDVQYGTISGDTTLSFCCWGPTDTQCSVELQLAIETANANAVITFPSEVVFTTNNYGITTVENYAEVGGSPTITIPNGVSQLNFLCSTLDCGQTIYITPINRPRISTQIQQRTPASTGFQGDVAGTVCVDPGVAQLVITNTYANDMILTSGTTSQLHLGMPIVFTGVVYDNIVAGTTYYVSSINSGNTFAISATPGGGNFNLGANSGTCYGNPITNMYVCVGSYNATEVSKTASNAYASTGNITLNSTTSLVVNAPIVFSNGPNIAYANTANANITAEQIYYIKSVSSPNITVSATRVAGIAGNAITLTDWTGNTDGGNLNVLGVISYNGSDIWKKMPLTSW